MKIKHLFYLAIILSVIKLSLWLLMPYIYINYNISPLNFGIIGGIANLLFGISILWLVFKVFMTKELKKYIKLLIPLVILIIAIIRQGDIAKLIWGNPKDDIKSEKIQESPNTQTNKVYLNSNYDKESVELESYVASGKVYSIFIYNETGNSIRANEKTTIKPNESFLIKIPDTMGIALSNGIQFFFGENQGLEVIDKNIQVSGIGGEWLDKLNVPESADWAFSILNSGEGDPIPKQ